MKVPSLTNVTSIAVGGGDGVPPCWVTHADGTVSAFAITTHVGVVEGLGDTENTLCVENTAYAQNTYQPTQFQLRSSQSSCIKHKVCVAGEHEDVAPNATSDRACVACEEGRYQPEAEQLECKRCGVCDSGPRNMCGGAFEGVCPTCQPGTYINSAANICESCDTLQGEYTARAGQASCGTCIDGKYSIGTGCIDCPPGFKCADGVKVACNQSDEYQSASGASACLTCEASSFFRPGDSRTACTAKTTCAAGTREASAGNATTDRACTECDAASGQYTSQANEQSCSTCASGTYSIGTGCIDCPPGFKCAGGVKVACNQSDEYQSASGASACLTCAASSFFRPGDSRTACTAKTTCAAGKREVSAGDAIHDRTCGDCPSGTYQNETNATSCKACDACDSGSRDKCGGAFEGVCPICPPGTFINSAAKICEGCPSGKYQNESDTTNCKVMHNLKRGAKHDKQAHAVNSSDALPSNNALETAFLHSSVTAIKIILTFLFQSSLLSSYQLDWGSSLRLLFGLGSTTATGDVTSVSLTNCAGLSFHREMKIVFAAPFLALALPLPLLLRARMRATKKVFGVAGVVAYRTAVLILLWWMHPAVFVKSVLALQTVRVGARDYVAADLSIPTDDPEYTVTRTLACVLLSTFVLLVPAFVFGSLYRHRAHLNSYEAQTAAPDWLHQHFSYFYISYKPRFYYWEIVPFMSKSILGLIAASASVALKPGAPLFVALWVVLINFILEFKYNAYQHKAESRLVKVTLFGLLGLMLAAMGLAVATLDGDPSFQHACRTTAVLRASDQKPAASAWT
eukprot:g2935.t1